jgi:hypothetical protein
MAILASTVLSRVRTQLIDPAPGTHWTDEELLQWMSDGQRTIVSAIPKATATITTQALVAGSLQTIAAAGYMLLAVYRNVGGRAVYEVERAILDRETPTWQTQTSTAAVTAYFRDETDPRSFWVYPPNTGAGTVTLSYSAQPAELTSSSDALGVLDIYATPLFDYVMFRAHQKDNDYAAAQGVAQQYLSNFSAFLASQSGFSTPKGP